MKGKETHKTEDEKFRELEDGKFRVPNFTGSRFPNSKLINERGIALVLVLVLATISLAIVATLIYLATQGVRSSGYYKRYETAKEAAISAADMTADLIEDRGTLRIDTIVSITHSCNCGVVGTVGDNTPANCFCNKLCDSTADWSSTLCPDDDTVTAGLQVSTDACENDDASFTLPGFAGTTYTVCLKIVDTVMGNSFLETSGVGKGGKLLGKGVVSTMAETSVTAPPAPYLHTVEIAAVNEANPAETFRWSMLYGY